MDMKYNGSFKANCGMKYTLVPFSHLVRKRQEMKMQERERGGGGNEREGERERAQRSLTWPRGSQESQGGDRSYWSYRSVYSALPTTIRCFTNRTNSHSGPSTCINECRVPELMDLTSPVTRKVLRLHICSTEVQCQSVPVWSHVQRKKRFNSSLMGMLFMCSSLPVGRVIESGRPAGAEWQPRGPWDQCFDNKCLLLFGRGLDALCAALPCVRPA